MATSSTTTQSSRLHVSAKVRALMARHGIDENRQQLTTLMGIMDASYSQVYRKISGRSSWLEEDLQRIAEHFKETLGTLFRDDADGRVAVPSDPIVWHAAKVNLAGIWLDCEVSLDKASDTPATLLLVGTPDGPRVESMGNVQAGSTVVGPVRHLKLDLKHLPQGGVAVLDDDPDVADSIVDNLQVRGMDAQSFHNKEELQSSARRFDTYILDWYSSDTSTTADLVQHLRAHHAPKATIVILTGQIQRDQAESDLAQLIHTHDVMVELKPMRLDLLLAKIEHKRQAAS